jgi:hypothetical protein
VTLAAVLVAVRADAEGSRYFQDLSDENPANATAQALAGFFQVRAGHDLASAMDRLDTAVTMDVGLPQYFRGLALAELLPGAGPSDEGAAAADTWRAEQVTADLELVLAARDQFPAFLLRAAYQALARACLLLGRRQQAAEALRRSGLGPVATDRPPAFTSFSVTVRDGMRLSVPAVLNPAPNVHVAQSYDFGDFAFIQTSAGVVAIDAGTSPDRVLAAMADLGLKDHGPVSHLILTHAHLDHIGGTAAVRGPDPHEVSCTPPGACATVRRIVGRASAPGAGCGRTAHDSGESGMQADSCNEYVCRWRLPQLLEARKGESLELIPCPRAGRASGDARRLSAARAGRGRRRRDHRG